jgi:hypothetical protein
MWMPRLSAAYQLNSKTVVRGGYGIFYDSLNALLYSPNQLGFSRTTSTNLSNDFGVNWLVGDPQNGISPMTNPFPVRADGTRYDAPVLNRLGVMAVAGSNFNFDAFETRHARQQRWRVGVQRLITQHSMIEAAYVGSRSDDVYITRQLSYLPGQYWATGNARNDTIANNLNANVPNPFQISNFADLRTSDPLVYQDMSTKGFFTSSTIRKQQLLRVYPLMTSLGQTLSPSGAVRTDEFDLNFERRFSKGLTIFASYTRLRARAADWFANEFDSSPTWEESNLARPHRIAAGGVWELPFGRGRAFFQHGIAGRVLGGWQIAMTYEFQPGPLIAFPNLFYYGNPSDIRNGSQTYSQWFNTANFERTPAKGPADYQARVFPQFVSGVRADLTNIANANLLREFKLGERVALQFRVDVMNLQNRTQMNAPDSNPLNTTFGSVSAQSRTQKRYYGFQARIRF